MIERRLLVLILVFVGAVGCIDDTSGSAAAAGADGDSYIGDPDLAEEMGNLPSCWTDDLGLMTCVEQERYVTDLELVADVRPPGSPHWQAVQDLCATRFEELGYTVERQAYETGVNVIGVLEGVEAPDEQIIVSAHYDSIEECAGADDNAAGVAAVLEVARVLALTDHAKTVIVACWDEEEQRLLGSEAYAQRALERGDQIGAVFVFETFAYYSEEPDSQQLPRGFELIFQDESAELAANDNRGDFIAIVGDESASEAIELIVSSADMIDLSTVVLALSDQLLENPMLHDLQRSDHGSFWGIGVPAMMITDTANYRNPHYHCREGEDSIDTLNHDFATQVIQSVLAAADTMLE